MQNPARVQRYQVDEDEFLTDVLSGLRQSPRAIPPKYFYDTRGSQLFDLICTTEEYYPTRTEKQLLEHYGERMVTAMGSDSVVIELGSGSAIKTPLLLHHMNDEAVYVPIDICESHLEQSTRRLKQMFPEQRMLPICADYMAMPTLPVSHDKDQRRVFYFPGSTIGNCTPAQSVQLLKQLASLGGDNAGLLIGVDCKKSPQILNAAYNDAEGYTAEFNRNLLLRMKNELNAQLNLNNFAHKAEYNIEAGRMEMHLVSQTEQPAMVNGETFLFEDGETIHTENSYKYTPDEFQQLAQRAGWKPKMLWSDTNNWFSIHYFIRDNH